MWRRYAIAFLSVALAGLAAQPANLTGTWRLNVEKSVWGSRPKPISVTLQIEHKEPALQYSGTVIYTGEEARPFSFTGGIDGRAYEMNRSFGPGTAVLRRLNNHSFESVFTTSDSTFVETTRTTISWSGRVLTRHIELKTAAGTSKSVERYDRM
jgi:hypothetical protein